MLAVEVIRYSAGVRPLRWIPSNWRCVHVAPRTVVYKVVACTNSTFVSVFDGVSEYVLGRAPANAL
jgi:hypothetical protein